MSSSRSTAIRNAVDGMLSIDRLAPFVSSGFIGGVVDVFALYLLVDFVGLGTMLGKVVTWELSVAVIFAINEQWAFAAAGKSGLWHLFDRFVRSNVVRFGGFLVTLGALRVLVHDLHVWYVFANVLAIWIGFVVNYVFECLFTWKIHQE